MKKEFIIILIITIVCNCQVRSQNLCTNTGACGSNLVPNWDMELTTSWCSTNFINNQFFKNQSPLQNWIGITSNNNLNNVTADYFNTGCMGNATNNCGSGNGSSGFFTWTSSGYREYIQVQLLSPLVAGKKYCISFKVKSIQGTGDGIGVFLSPNMIDYDVLVPLGGGNGFLGTFYTPQVQNPSGNMIGSVCQTFAQSYCAQGNEQWIVVGNFKNNASTNHTGTNNYMIIDEVKVVEMCTFIPNLNLYVGTNTLNCGSNTTLFASYSGTVGPATYTWTAPVSNTLLGVGPHTISPIQTTTYVLTSNVAGICSAISNSIVVNVLPSSVGGFTLSSLTSSETCSNGNGSATIVAVPNGNYQYAWSSNINSVTNIVNNLSMGNYTVTVTNTLCAHISSIEVNILGSITPSILSVNITPNKCGINDGAISISAHPSTCIFNWNPLVSSANTANSLVGGIYSVTLANQGCITQTIIPVNTIEKAEIIGINVLPSRCDFATGSTSIISNYSNGVFIWVPAVSTNSFANNVFPGSYTVTVGSGSCATVDVIKIPISESPKSIEIVKHENICNNNNGKITITNVYGGTSPYNYSINNNNYLSVSSFDNLSTGIYSVQIKDANGCTFFENFEIIDLNFETDLFYKITMEDDCSNNFSIIIDSIKGGNSPYLLSINNGSFFYEDTIKGLREQSYLVTIKDSTNCVTNNFINLKKSKPNPLTYIPNSFTPNGDGLNDFWFPYIDCAYMYNCFIYDRWGILIKELKDVSEKWDGYYKGKELPIGIYNYIIDVTGYDRKIKRITGNINLIK